MFFRQFGLVELAISRKFQWRRGHNFLAWKFGDGPANFISLDCDVVEFVLDSAQRGADSGGARSNDHDVVDAGREVRTSALVNPLRDDVNAVASLFHRILDQRQPA